eukprot:CAMPEP_0177688860 /NCGR_PEP_ID=MMETSP0447-20121125/34870_1 /TAXON_ID=0 /ORGANISM="Stygamoeba regulata, Strain BSH-02190019" /LENGTH=768 /DNA_ID=CAMNT_0019199163 /DNA_START=43 /DNA_END=2346 /DNA_ORIENTATION=-
MKEVTVRTYLPCQVETVFEEVLSSEKFLRLHFQQLGHDLLDFSPWHQAPRNRKQRIIRTRGPIPHISSSVHNSGDQSPPSTITASVKYILLHHFDAQGILYMSVRRFIETSSVSRSASTDPKIDWRSEWTVRPYLFKTDPSTGKLTGCRIDVQLIASQIKSLSLSEPEEDWVNRVPLASECSAIEFSKRSLTSLLMMATTQLCPAQAFRQPIFQDVSSTTAATSSDPHSPQPISTPSGTPGALPSTTPATPGRAHSNSKTPVQRTPSRSTGTTNSSTSRRSSSTPSHQYKVPMSPMRPFPASNGKTYHHVAQLPNPLLTTPPSPARTAGVPRIPALESSEAAARSAETLSASASQEDRARSLQNVLTAAEEVVQHTPKRSSAGEESNSSKSAALPAGTSTPAESSLEDRPVPPSVTHSSALAFAPSSSRQTNTGSQRRSDSSDSDSDSDSVVVDESVFFDAVRQAPTDVSRFSGASINLTGLSLDEDVRSELAATHSEIRQLNSLVLGTRSRLASQEKRLTELEQRNAVAEYHRLQHGKLLPAASPAELERLARMTAASPAGFSPHRGSPHTPLVPFSAPYPHPAPSPSVAALMAAKLAHTTSVDMLPTTLHSSHQQHHQQHQHQQPQQPQQQHLVSMSHAHSPPHARHASDELASVAVAAAGAASASSSHGMLPRASSMSTLTPAQMTLLADELTTLQAQLASDRSSAKLREAYFQERIEDLQLQLECEKHSVSSSQWRLAGAIFAFMLLWPVVLQKTSVSELSTDV